MKTSTSALHFTAICIAFHFHIDLLCASATGASVRPRESDDINGNGLKWTSGWDIHSAMFHFVDYYFPNCHLLVIRESEEVHVAPLLRSLESQDRPVTVVDPWKISTEEASPMDDAVAVTDAFFIGRATIGCRVAIVYLGKSSNDTLMRFLEAADVWKYPSMKVLSIGPMERKQEFLLQHPLRNVIHALFFTLPKDDLLDGYLEGGRRGVSRVRSIKIYLHCLYCKAGYSDVVLAGAWSEQSERLSEEKLFPDQFKDFNGHKMRIVTMPFFPFIDFTPDSEEPKSTVTLTESLDLVLLTEVSTKLNFTYELRLPIDKEWAQPLGNGSWTGLVGTLQREDADFSTCLFYDHGRMQACDFTRLFAPDPMVIVSHKAQPLPPYLAIVKPFSEMTWIWIFMTFVIAGIVFWIMQKGWREISSGIDALVQRSSSEESDPGSQVYLNFTSTIFFTWGLVLQQQPFQYPTNLYGRLWITWWLIFSLLVASLYRSALIASLSVPQLSVPVDSFSQLVEQEGWSYGMEPHYSVGWLWLKKSERTDIQKIFKELEFLQIPEHMQRILDQGNHALISWTHYIKNIIISEYTDRNGYTPMHMSRNSYMGTGCSWATRRGMPYYRTIDMVQQYIVQGHLMQLWLDEIFKGTFKKAREKNTTTIYAKSTGGQVVFSLFHLQGAFYVLFIGLTLSSILFILEYATDTQTEAKF